jgi:hypothetical protein
MQNSPCGTPQAHGSDLATVKYPTGRAPRSISPDMHWISVLYSVICGPLSGTKLPQQLPVAPLTLSVQMTA